MSDNAKAPEFSKVRAALWPIHGYEMKKFLPMSLLMTCILFVYTMIRDLKDTFISTKTVIWANADKSANANLLSALKFFFVLPAAFLAVMVFTKLVGKFGSKKTFYIIVSAFAVWFAVFAFLLYPNASKLIPDQATVTAMKNGTLPLFQYCAVCIANWPFALFYVMAEIWGTLAMSSLFWQFANAVTMKNEVKRFFAYFALPGNIGVVLCGSIIAALAKDKVNFDRNVVILILIAIMFCFLTMGFYYYINAKILTDPKFFDASAVKKKKKKAKVSTMEGIKILCKSPYMLLVTVLVLGYGVGINFSEAIFNNRLRAVYSSSSEFMTMKAMLSIITGVFTIIVTVVGSNVLRKFSWKTSALVTPVLFGGVGAIFFLLVACDYLWGITTIFGMSTIVLAVWFGLVQDALVKSVKYSLFDTTKSMTYIPLDEDTKTKGQAAVEVIGGRAGKGGASFVQQLMLGSAAGVTMINFFVPVVIIFGVTVVSWIFAIFKLSPKYEAAVEAREKEAAASKA